MLPKSKKISKNSKKPKDTPVSTSNETSSHVNDYPNHSNQNFSEKDSIATVTSINTESKVPKPLTNLNSTTSQARENILQIQYPIENYEMTRTENITDFQAILEELNQVKCEMEEVFNNLFGTHDENYLFEAKNEPEIHQQAFLLLEKESLAGNRTRTILKEFQKFGIHFPDAKLNQGRESWNQPGYYAINK